MNTAKEQKSAAGKDSRKMPFWRVVLENVFGAAVRLHQYRDRRDALLTKVFLEYEQQQRDKQCCNE